MSIDVLQNRIRKLKNPSAVGLDPRLELIPGAILEDAFSRFGQTPEGAAEAQRIFCIGVLDALADIVPAVKFQTADFLAFGHAGIAALETLSSYAAKKGYYVLMDTMRGDVGPTAQVCANTYFGGTTIGGQAYLPFCADAVTLNAYPGSDGIKPFLPYCKDQGKNLFLLVKTSNKSSREIQDLISGDRVVHTAMADLAMRWSADLLSKSGYSEVGIVVGATHPAVLRTLREKYDRLFFLVPGYGAQGGGAKDVSNAFDRFGHGALVCASRSILAAWQKDGTDGAPYADSIRAAAIKMRADIGSYITVI